MWPHWIWLPYIMAAILKAQHTAGFVQVQQLARVPKKSKGEGVNCKWEPLHQASWRDSAPGARPLLGITNSFFTAPGWARYVKNNTQHYKLIWREGKTTEEQPTMTGFQTWNTKDARQAQHTVSNEKEKDRQRFLESPLNNSGIFLKCSCSSAAFKQWRGWYGQTCWMSSELWKVIKTFYYAVCRKVKRKAY